MGDSLQCCTVKKSLNDWLCGCNEKCGVLAVRDSHYVRNDSCALFRAFANVYKYEKCVAMIRILKLIVSLLMFLTVLFFISTILTITTSSPTWLSAAFSFACASLVAWFTWKLVSGEKTGTGIAVIGGALMLGGLCFIVGFLGPMAFAKDTNQGPLIGIFIATPLGVIIGAIGGYIYASRQNADVED